MRLSRVIIGLMVTCSSVALGAVPASASPTTYTCPLTSASLCDPPLTATINGTVVVGANSTAFDPGGTDNPGSVQVNNSSQIPMTFPIDFSITVSGVGVPSSTVGDYDVVRGTPNGNWKLEIMARNSRTTARAACHFKGKTGGGNAVGGPDLSTMTGPITLRCVDTGTVIETFVNGQLVKTTNVATGAIPNPGPLLIGAKNTNGGDQFSGNASNFSISVGS